MQIRSVASSPADIEADALVLTLFQLADGEKPDSQADAWSSGIIGEIYSRGEFSGKALETAVIHRPAGLKASRLLLVGGGKRDAYSSAVARNGAAVAVRQLQPKGAKSIAIAIPERFDVAQAMTEGALLASFDVGELKTSNEGKGALETLTIVSSADVSAAVDKGRLIAEGQNFARSLGNAPPNLLTPPALVERSRQMAAQAGLEIEIRGRDQMAKMGMGGLLGVAQGSAEPPALIIVRYTPDKAAGVDHLGLVGKAVTFDTGGVSIKPSADMDLMKYDMAGGAAVLGAMQAIAALKPSRRVTALVPTVENMVGSRAQRPGDVVTTLSGKTVEILNTDAEGRMILADALTYGQQLGCSRMVDAATLTGAIVVALGHERAGLFANNDALQQEILAAAETVGEKFWPMPLDEEYKELLKSPIADFPNIGSRWGGSITAAMFLKQFADPTPWAHLDIAGTAWLEQDKPYMPKGPTGMAARTFVELALRP
jgi:leucyl aminopeptidase